MEQLICHLFGDYILQSHWMAANKGKSWRAALIHGVAYTVPFLFLSGSWTAMWVIFSTHVVIDRYRLARFLCWAKNWLFAPNNTSAPVRNEMRDQRGNTVGYSFGIQWIIHRTPWKDCDPNTGFPVNTPIWLSTWLMIICDNTLHLTINYLALRHL